MKQAFQNLKQYGLYLNVLTLHNKHTSILNSSNPPSILAQSLLSRQQATDQQGAARVATSEREYVTHMSSFFNFLDVFFTDESYGKITVKVKSKYDI